jgi:hypothetical protein
VSDRSQPTPAPHHQGDQRPRAILWRRAVVVGGFRRRNMRTATMTTTEHPDAAIFEMIAHLSKLWQSIPPLDERAVALGRAGNLSDAKELNRRSEDIVGEACGLERNIARAAAHTLEGHAAKIRAIVAANFDSEDLIEIAWLLGQEAARLGLGPTMPNLQPPTALDAAA